MFARALLAFLALPGIVAGMVPAVLAWVDPWRGGGTSIGGVVLACGLLILLWCVRDFYVSGKGTLAPWSPPKRLVVVGLYRFMRNPMYVGVLILVSGWGILTGSPLLGCYVLVLALAFHVRVIVNEEPWLSKQFPSEWVAYSSEVPRWWPRSTPWYERPGSSPSEGAGV